MNDMLVKYLKGKKVDHKLQCKTIISLFLESRSTNDIDLYKLVTNGLRETLAEAIINKPKLVHLTQRDSPENLGKEYMISTYCFSPQEFEQLIKETFEYGYEAAKEAHKQDSRR